MIRRVTYNTVDIYKGEIKTYMKNILQPIIKISLHCKYPKRCVVFSISFLPEHAFWLLCFRLNVEIKNFSFYIVIINFILIIISAICMRFVIIFYPFDYYYFFNYLKNFEYILKFCSEKKNLTFYKIQPDCSEIILLVILCCKNIG
ncbi:hypothetical protein PFAG_03521 [Plasmodium falciparum Santa Lucia]|uniref:Uncharacterized protein n=3 Tax=Plasmodium falciparum TaxID=5833 RepID=W7JL34_PLAFA|nr:hypothetical protein PFFVO_05577 [Plasmodium falciparum Vietnam Oak-Knoll (FVO)]EUT83646.1 hypothetical protein PFAG_03521 [Plasmodium falciparum Santa Lucia]EWC75708.1 hypothetical protein C923_03601 [Plasmodium falciparum UGT5.1]